MTQDAPLAVFEGPGGAAVEIFDLTRPYGYQNVFWVKLRIVGRFPGAQEPFEREVDRLGVFAQDLERVKGELLEGFRGTLPYLFRENFAQKLDAAAKAKTPQGGYGKTP